jgi:hypothetical protein
MARGARRTVSLAVESRIDHVRYTTAEGVQRRQIYKQIRKKTGVGGARGGGRKGGRK